MSPLPTNLQDGFPEDWDDLFEHLKIQSALAQQIRDRMRRRISDPLEIQASNPAESLLEAIRLEMGKLREDNRLLSEVVHLGEQNQQVIIAKLKGILSRQGDHNHRLEKLERNKKD